MENITNLIAQAQNAIQEFEKYMYTNHLEKYITIKEFVSVMQSKISSVESMLRINAITNENVNEVTNKLNSVISRVASIKTSFENGHNIELVVDEFGEYCAKEIESTGSLTNFTDYQPIESSAVKITNYSQEQDMSLESIPVPVTVEEPKVTEEIPAFGQSPMTESVQNGESENFNDALDIQAINNFINQAGISEQPTQGIGITL